MTNKIPSKENLEDMLKLFEPESSVLVLSEDQHGRTPLVDH